MAVTFTGFKLVTEPLGTVEQNIYDYNHMQQCHIHTLHNTQTCYIHAVNLVIGLVLYSYGSVHYLHCNI